MIIISIAEDHFYDGKQNEQILMAISNMNSMIQDDHLSRQIIDFANIDFIYEKASPYQSNIGRKIIDPIVLI